jgi:hypothetical protein
MTNIMENTTKFSNIEEVSTAFNLDITETTTGVNGYPNQCLVMTPT